MSFTKLRSTAAAASLACTLGLPMPSVAGVIDFSGVFDVFGPGQAQAHHDDASGYRFSAADGDALIDFSFCAFPDFCALGNDTEHLQALNDSVITLTGPNGGPFDLRGFDASFIPSPSVNYSGANVALQLTGQRRNGQTVSALLSLFEDFTFGGGDFAFTRYTPGKDFTDLVSVSFSACFINGAACERAGGLLTNDAQFALDNLAVPEPSGYGLAALALGALALTSRRRVRR